MVTYQTLISVDELADGYLGADWTIVDCRFSLADTSAGRIHYLAAHIPGALYAHLDEDLSGTVVTGVTGRHPLPDVDVFVRTLRKWGVSETTQVVAYDDSGGSIAARLWWMLRWLGHENVAVLDGGWPAWQQSGYPTLGGEESRPMGDFAARPRPRYLVTTEEVSRHLGSPALTLFDARAASRYRGEDETIDPVAGHIPGSISAPYAENLREDGCFRSVDEVRARFEQILAGRDVESAVFYCGSGVTAAHDLLALEYVGMPGARIYPGSWSEWIVDQNRPISVGPNP